MADMTFGEQVLQEAARLKAAGFDANQIAGILCRKDPEGKNYGIGILLGRDGNPMPTSPTLIDYLQREIADSATGHYMNSDPHRQALKEAVLSWQGVPESWWPQLDLVLPSDAGTGAVQLAVQAAVLYKEGTQELAVEQLGWPAYRAIASSLRLGFREFPAMEPVHDAGLLPLYQAGPLNTTGQVPSQEQVARRAQRAAREGDVVVLDRAYSGFEFARDLAADGYRDVMRRSFQTQVLPFLEAGASFLLAISPTKAFVTFSLRPCGLLIGFFPEADRRAKAVSILASLIRARGSSFEHAVTRAFVKAMIHDRAKLEGEHSAALGRCAEAELAWSQFSKGMPLEKYFTRSYAGLFRNPLAKPDTARDLYNSHLYPVFADGRCRLNVTGLPADPSIAALHVSRMAAYCH